MRVLPEATTLSMEARAEIPSDGGMMPKPVRLMRAAAVGSAAMPARQTVGITQWAVCEKFILLSPTYSVCPTHWDYKSSYACYQKTSHRCLTDTEEGLTSSELGQLSPEARRTENVGKAVSKSLRHPVSRTCKHL